MKYPILLPNIFNHPFTYESDFDLKIGEYVSVPFGKSKLTGVVWDKLEDNERKKFNLKKVFKKLKVKPIKKTTINFLNWFSEYNIIPKGMALKLMLLSNGVIEDNNNKNFKIFKSSIKKNLIKLSQDQKKSLKEMTVSNNKFRVHVLLSLIHI